MPLVRIYATEKVTYYKELELGEEDLLALVQMVQDEPYEISPDDLYLDIRYDVSSGGIDAEDVEIDMKRDDGKWASAFE